MPPGPLTWRHVPGPAPSGRPSPPPPPCHLPRLPGGRTEARRGACPRGLGHLLLPPGHLLLPLVALDPVRDATHPPRPLTLSLSSSPPLALSRAATEHTRRRRRALSWPPATPSLSDTPTSSASTPSFLPTDPRPSGSPATPPPSPFRRRPPKLPSVDSPDPVPPLPRQQHQKNCGEPSTRFPLSPCPTSLSS